MAAARAGEKRRNWRLEIQEILCPHETPVLILRKKWTKVVMHATPRLTSLEYSAIRIAGGSAVSPRARARVARDERLARHVHVRQRHGLGVAGRAGAEEGLAVDGFFRQVEADVCGLR